MTCSTYNLWSHTGWYNEHMLSNQCQKSHSVPDACVLQLVNASMGNTMKRILLLLWRQSQSNTFQRCHVGPNLLVSADQTGIIEGVNLQPKQASDRLGAVGVEPCSACIYGPALLVSKL